jgi:transposase
MEQRADRSAVWVSGGLQRRGHITQAGSSRLRWLLVEAAWRVTTHSKRAETQALIRRRCLAFGRLA